MNGQLKYFSYSGSGTYNIKDLSSRNPRLIGVSCTSIAAPDTVKFTLQFGPANICLFNMYQTGTALETQQKWFGISGGAVANVPAFGGTTLGAQGNFPYAVHPTIRDVGLGVSYDINYAITITGTGNCTVFFIDDTNDTNEPV